MRLLATPWTVAHQAPPSMGFSRQEYWRGLPFPSPGDHLNPGIKPRSPTLQVDSLPSEPPGKCKLVNHFWSRNIPILRYICSCVLSYNLQNLGKTQTFIYGRKNKCIMILGLPGSSDGKESACNAGDLGLIPESRRSLGERNGNPL